MPPVTYSMSVSLDGFVNDPTGGFGWTAPTPDLFRFHLDQVRPLTTYLCGRRLYQEMLVWETAEQTMTGEAELEFARRWRSLPKLVFSRTLTSVEGNARLATGDVATELRRLRAQSGEGLIAIAGATLAAAAIEQDLVDDYRRFVYPVVVGGGTPYFPPLAAPLELRLVESRTFGSRTVYLRHQRVR
ncbi:dihydrofolate reductase [Crossiella equi]|uniref:Dihydrofolate reductase n=1 Tax=Crossiella equi TaxID=130796 RepID=A0ABS5A8H6_9PSEU|nr:dihydrofolate reductase family protein [Crossiella equi]MBP2472893.1 dihydrofolate reductase [Crossiella equi]